ncbi:hypothetical protein [Saccharococcus thermophilus]|uniref:PAS domain-containing protein n=1 Tax=Saccharococcus thermophilus TaxID=29396 RepID=A0A846MEC1_9BACL|nr:hypothetical protein [Saccharococcus thermophilus]NIK14972.1 PAS domain-containing protein [Saccharococcus thermophilus]
MTSQYVAFFQHFTDAVAIFDLEGSILYMNPIFQGLFHANEWDRMALLRVIDPMLEAVKNGESVPSYRTGDKNI